MVTPTFTYRQTAGASVTSVKVTEKADEIPTGEEMASVVADLGEQKEGARLGWGRCERRRQGKTESNRLSGGISSVFG